MSNLKSNFILIFLSISVSLNLSAKVRDFETTRLRSSAGAGVAAILVNETAILNPASIVFIPISSFYYQKGSSNLESKSIDRTSDFSTGNDQMYLISDSTTQLKGTFSYQDQADNQFTRKRFTSSLASNVTRNTSVGILYRYTMDHDKIIDEDDNFHQAILGFTHINSSKLSFGGTLVDPFLSNKEDARVILGIQYSLTENLLFLLDAGTNFNDKPNDNTLYKGALQLNFFKDLFLRGGQFYDRASHLKGAAWGISWIGPRLSLEYATKTSEVLEDYSDYLFKGEKIIESSVSIAIVF